MAYLAAKTVIFFNQSLPPREGGEEKRREEKRREENAKRIWAPIADHGPGLGAMT
jgi:hypothetical protein